MQWNKTHHCNKALCDTTFELFFTFNWPSDKLCDLVDIFLYLHEYKQSQLLGMDCFSHRRKSYQTYNKHTVTYAGRGPKYICSHAIPIAKTQMCQCQFSIHLFSSKSD